MTAWSGVIAPSRACDWSLAGVEGGVPSTASWPACDTADCNSIAPGSGTTVTAALVNSAIQNAKVGGVGCSASNPCVVRLRAGNYTISGLNIRVSGVVLRGEGADQTKITFNGISPSSCFTSDNCVIGICPGADTVVGSTNWTGGYALGTNVITLGSTSSITVGQPFFMDQTNDSSDTGDVLVCDGTGGTPPCSAEGSGTAFHRSGRAYVQMAKAVSKTATTVTIDPPVLLPNIRASQSPQVYIRPYYIEQSGVEDLSIDYTSLGAGAGIKFVYGHNSWVKGVRCIFNSGGTGGATYPIYFINSLRCTVRDSYIFGPTSAAGSTTKYPINVSDSFSLLFENNILQREQGSIVPNGPFAGSVFAYNFFPGREGPVAVLHNAGDMMNLYEGNIGLGFYGDIVHGTHHFNTVFRNAFVGDKYAMGLGTVAAAVHIQAKNRFFNIVGNVMGDTHFTSYETNMADSSSSVYCLGWKGSASGVDPGNDANVKRTLMRWGNWDSVTNGVRWDASEVPSGITSYSNPVPANQNLPASFYLSARPSWFRALPFPAIGPDVTGGTITNLGGHAYLNPAADCFLNVMGGPVNGGGSPLNFNATKCYGTTQTPPTPTGPTLDTVSPVSGMQGTSATLHITGSGL